MSISNNNQWMGSLRENSAPFTDFNQTPGYAAAYNYLSLKNGSQYGIRYSYNTLITQDLSKLEKALKNSKETEDGTINYSKKELDFVIDTLINELEAAKVVAQFFSLFISNFYNSLWTIEEGEASAIIAGLQLTDPKVKKVKFDVSNLILGITESLINLVPYVGGTIAGLLQTAIQSLPAGSPDSTQANQSLQLETNISNFWEECSNNMLYVEQNIGIINNQVCNDWGMMQWVANQTLQGGQLYLSGENLPDMIQATNNSFKQTAINALLPVNFAIFQAYIESNKPLTTIPVRFILSYESNNLKTKEIQVTFDKYTPMLIETSADLQKSDAPNYKYSIRWIANNSTDPTSTLQLQPLNSGVLFQILNNNYNAFYGLGAWQLPFQAFRYQNGFNIRLINTTNIDFNYNSPSQGGANTGVISLLNSGKIPTDDSSGIILSGEAVDWIVGNFEPNNPNLNFLWPFGPVQLTPAEQTLSQYSLSFTCQQKLENDHHDNDFSVATQVEIFPKSNTTVFSLSLVPGTSQIVGASGKNGGGFLIIIAANYQAPVSAIEIYKINGVNQWSQPIDNNQEPDVISKLGPYWVNGNSVSYAVSYLYPDNVQSTFSPWMDWILINDYALAVLSFPETVPNDSPADGPPLGFFLYRQFQLANGSITTPNILGYYALDGSTKNITQANGDYILTDEGLVMG